MITRSHIVYAIFNSIISPSMDSYTCHYPTPNCATVQNDGAPNLHRHPPLPSRPLVRTSSLTLHPEHNCIHLPFGLLRLTGPIRTKPTTHPWVHLFTPGISAVVHSPSFYRNEFSDYIRLCQIRFVSLRQTHRILAQNQMFLKARDH